jgi:hypothetical protein
LVLGAHSLRRSKVVDKQRFGPWLRRLEQRVHRNIAVVAMANKLARVIWAVLARDGAYRRQCSEAA